MAADADECMSNVADARVCTIAQVCAAAVDSAISRHDDVHMSTNTDTSESTSSHDRDALARQALDQFARDPGRSVAVCVEIGELRWSAHVAGDVTRPAASLLKLPLAMAVESAMAADRLGLFDNADVSVGSVLDGWSEPTVLRSLHPDRTVDAHEMLRLMISSSDGPSARWLLNAVGLPAVVTAVASSGCNATEVKLRPGAAGGSLSGVTTAADALRMLAAACDQQRFPITAAALAASTLNSRIPLGVLASDIEIAHKTGTLFSVAHDVALLTVPGGEVRIAFLSDAQHDTLVTGYDMGICTQSLLAAFGVGVTGTRSVDG